MTSGRDRQVVGVDGGDHHEADDVVDDRQGEDEAAQSLGSIPAEQGEQAEGEGGVGRHRHAPTVRRRAPGIDRQIEPDGDRHPAEPRQHRKDDPGSLPELADVEFAAGLQPDHQEEEAHQPAVDPAAQIEGYRSLTDVNGQARLPHLLVGATRRR